MSTFREHQTELLGWSGWNQCPSVATAVADAGLPAPTREYLHDTLTTAAWSAAEQAVAALEQHFRRARFADEVSWGLLLVPDHRRLDTRQPMPGQVREDQRDASGDDVVDPDLTPGVLAVATGAAWTLIGTVVGPYGPSLGSYREVAGAGADEFTVLGQDIRRLMTRQVWGARVLQAGHRHLPDSDHNTRWTFTHFPGEPLTDGRAESSPANRACPVPVAGSPETRRMSRVPWNFGGGPLLIRRR